MWTHNTLNYNYYIIVSERLSFQIFFAHICSLKLGAVCVCSKVDIFIRAARGLSDFHIWDWIKFHLSSDI